MTEEYEPLDRKLEARFMSLNFRLSNVENHHKDLNHRIDEIEDELKEVWESILRFKEGR